MTMSKSDEVLMLLQEECAEVIQAISKVRRFGAEKNMEDLCKEIGDVEYLLSLAKIHVKGVSDFDYAEHRNMKFHKLRIYSSVFK